MQNEEVKKAEAEERENEKARKRIDDLMQGKEGHKKVNAVNLSLVIAVLGFLLVWVLHSYL